MDLAITLIVISLLLFWPRRASVRYYLLLIPAAAGLVVAVIFAPFILLTPIFYVGLAIIAVVIIYRALISGRKDETDPKDRT